MAFYSGSIAKDCYCYYLRHLIVSENEENVILIDFSCFHELPVICHLSDQSYNHLDSSSSVWWCGGAGGGGSQIRRVPLGGQLLAGHRVAVSWYPGIWPS